MERHCASALKIAQFLEAHPRVEAVIYPGLASHPQHALARRQMRGFGGIVTARVSGGLAGAKRFLERTQLFTLAESLGGVESLIEHPAIMTHASVPAEVRAALGIDDGLVRLSVGIEDADDLIDDLQERAGVRSRRHRALPLSPLAGRGRNPCTPVGCCRMRTKCRTREQPSSVRGCGA